MNSHQVVFSLMSQAVLSISHLLLHQEDFPEVDCERSVLDGNGLAHESLTVGMLCLVVFVKINAETTADAETCRSSQDHFAIGVVSR